MIFFIAIAMSFMSYSQPVLTFTPVVTGLSEPVDVVSSKDGTNRLFIAQQRGIVKVVLNDVLQPGNFLDVSSLVPSTGEFGLFSIVFHPNFSSNGFFYIYYIENGTFSIVVARYTVVSGSVSIPSRVEMFRLAPLLQSNHNGGKLNFGPDGFLYFGIGDGSGSQGGGNHSQLASTKWGKMIRLDVNNTNPATNNTIFNFGMRNPWRWSFDKSTGDVWIADVGEGSFEEINYTPFASAANLNYGWRCYEGSQTYNTMGCSAQSNYFFPIYTYPHNSSGGFSVTGGYVYRGPTYLALQGYYICADYVSARVWLIKSNGSGGWVVTTQTVGVTNHTVGFGETESGELYSLRLDGTLYKISSSGAVPVTLISFSAQPNTGYNLLQWKTANEQSLSHYAIESSTDGVNFTQVGQVVALNTINLNTYTYKHYSTFPKVYYRLRTVNLDGSSSLSNVVLLQKKTQISVYPTLVTNSLTVASVEKVGECLFVLFRRKKSV